MNLNAILRLRNAKCGLRVCDPPFNHSIPSFLPCLHLLFPSVLYSHAHHLHPSSSSVIFLSYLMSYLIFLKSYLLHDQSDPFMTFLESFHFWLWFLNYCLSIEKELKKRSPSV